MRSILRGTLPWLLLVAAAACNQRPEAPPAASAGRSGAEPGTPIVLTDATAAAGLRFVHDNGASPRRYLPETMGSGVAFFDADGDGDPDLYFANSRSLADPNAPASPAGFYRNRGDGTFEEAGRQAGFTEAFFGLGTAVGDLDNDGDLDLFVSGLDGDRCYRNRGDGTFQEVSAELGLTGRGFGSSAAFLDADGDGWLDLFVGRYVEWSPQSDVRCSPDGEHPSYCTPEIYPGQSNRLYHNLGGQRFADVTEEAGLLQPEGKTLGVVPLDYDGDGWPDLAVANDTWRNALYVNRGDGTFRDAAIELGMAFSLSGATRGAMGIDAGDLDHRGRSDLVIGNFSHEMSALYRSSEHGLFSDDAAQLGLGLPTLMSLTFGTLAVDLDGDGWLDVVFANGHIEPDVARFQPQQSYAQPLQVFHHRGDGQGFEPVPPPATTPSWAGPWVARGLAAGDADGDGDLDLVLTQNGGPARLLRNDSASQSWLRLRLIGHTSNRTGYGAVATAVAGPLRITRTLVSGRSYLSASEPVLTFGLGTLDHLDRVEIRWPSGIEQQLPSPPINRILEVEEPPPPG